MTYSFSDLDIVFSSPAMGSISCNGEGIGDITFSRSNDMSAHDVGADGRVMTSKIVAKNGTVTLNIQQTSPLANWLVRYVNYVENASSSAFTGLTITASSRVMARQHTAFGCSPQKMPDAAYAQQGARRAFAFLAETTEEDVA